MSDSRLPILMPKLGYDMVEGVISSWIVAVGNRVERGEPLLEVENDKATIEVEALATGTLAQIVREAGDVVPVGEVVGYIDGDD